MQKKLVFTVLLAIIVAAFLLKSLPKLSYSPPTSTSSLSEGEVCNPSSDLCKTSCNCNKGINQQDVCCSIGSGGSCNNANMCQSGNCILTGSGSCTDGYRSIGSSCNTNQDCGAGKLCLENSDGSWKCSS